jgi:hypothetical protein
VFEDKAYGVETNSTKTGKKDIVTPHLIFVFSLIVIVMMIIFEFVCACEEIMRKGGPPIYFSVAPQRCPPQKNAVYYFSQHAGREAGATTYLNQSNRRGDARQTTLAMGATLSSATTYLSITLCDGSSRKLIAGWWYVIFFVGAGVGMGGLALRSNDL